MTAKKIRVSGAARPEVVAAIAAALATRRGHPQETDTGSQWAQAARPRRSWAGRGSGRWRNGLKR